MKIKGLINNRQNRLKRTFIWVLAVKRQNYEKYYKYNFFLLGF